MKKLFEICLICLALIPSVTARHLPLGDRYDTASASGEICGRRVSDTSSNLWLSFSNRMAIGRPFANFPLISDDVDQDPDFPYNYSVDFPGGSGREYLYGAGLWVGGIKGNDTLVVHSFDIDYPIPELNPPACPLGEITTSVIGLADIEHTAIAYDTIYAIDSLTRCDLGDCNDWYPLGIEVRSHSYSWQSPPYDRMTIIEYTIKNTDSLPLEEGWVGIYADCDIGLGEEPHNDDISGYIDGAINGNGEWVDLDIAYSMDMDGDPDFYGFGDQSTIGAFGVQVLGLSTPGYRVNFNWWVADYGGGVDWGPIQAEAAYRDLGGIYATPYGDSNKYFVMSYPEVDYNQIESGLNRAGWVEPAYTDRFVAKGRDTRFLISAGPFDLAPGEEVVFTVSFIAGDNVVENPFIEIWFDPFDPLSVADYYEITSFDQLVEAALAAKAAFDSDYLSPPPGQPQQFALLDYDDDFVSLSWSPKSVTDLAGYRIMQKIGNSQWQIAVELLPDDTTVILTELDSDIEYRLAVAAFDNGGTSGMLSEPIIILPGRPHPPTKITGSGRNGYPVLRWNLSLDSEVEYYRLYRLDNNQQDTIAITEIADTVHIDVTAIGGEEYDYYVTAIGQDGLESEPSVSFRLIPFMSTSGILVVNYNSGNITSNLVFETDYFDSLAARGLPDIPYSYHRATVDDPLTISKMSHYSLVIISTENRHGSLTSYLAELLEMYLGNGGNIILIMRHAALETGPVSQPQVMRFGGDDFMARFLLIDSSYIGPQIIQSGYQLIGDMTGASPMVNGLPSQTWDSVSVNAFGYRVPEGLPYCGFIWPQPEAEPIFSYLSNNPDSITHGQVTGIRYKGEDYHFCLLNFPLSVMQPDSAAALLHALVVDMDGHFICGDINGDFRLNLGDLYSYVRYLYYDYEPPALYLAGDVNCDGSYSLDDVLLLLNFIFYQGLAPACCN